MTVYGESVGYYVRRPGRPAVVAQSFFLVGWDDHRVWGSYDYGYGRRRYGSMSWGTFTRDWRRDGAEDEVKPA
jgi:hypothetical protein